MGEWFALLSAEAFASSNVMVKKGTTPSSKNNGAFISILFTAIISGMIVLTMGLFYGWPSLNAEGFIWFVLAGVLTSFLGRTFLYSSIQHLGSVRASAIKRLNPFFAVLIGVILLNERVTSTLIVGMILIFLGFVMLAVQSLYSDRQGKKEQKGQRNDLISVTSKSIHIIKSIANLGYIYGPISALAYAFGYAARKNGLTEIPDPFFGTMIGAFIGALIFVILALFQEHYRSIIRTTFTQFHLWLFLAGISISMGQILYFMALAYIAVSRVALITSIEVIFTLFLSAWVFKTQEGITKLVLFAAVISMLGAGIIALDRF
jgi:drug/metabolite transporter (DMT)-like permease